MPVTAITPHAGAAAASPQLYEFLLGQPDQGWGLRQWQTRTKTIVEGWVHFGVEIVVVIPPLLPAAAQFELPFALLDGREIDLVGWIGLCARCLQEECGA